MEKLEKIVNGVYLIGGIMLLLIVIMSMSSCGSSKMYHVGTGQEMYKADCGGYRIK